MKYLIHLNIYLLVIQITFGASLSFGQGAIVGSASVSAEKAAVKSVATDALKSAAVSETGAWIWKSGAGAVYGVLGRN